MAPSAAIKQDGCVTRCVGTQMQSDAWLPTFSVLQALQYCSRSKSRNAPASRKASKPWHCCMPHLPQAQRLADGCLCVGHGPQRLEAQRGAVLGSHCLLLRTQLHRRGQEYTAKGRGFSTSKQQGMRLSAITRLISSKLGGPATSAALYELWRCHSMLHWTVAPPTPDCVCCTAPATCCAC